MNKKKLLQFFSYCYEAELEKASEIYYNNKINIRWNNDKIFKFCCQSAQDMYGYNERFTQHSVKLLNTIKYLASLCSDYNIKIINDKLIDWNVKKQIIITI